MGELSDQIRTTQADIAKLQESGRLTEEVDRLKGGLSENIYAINALANQNADRVKVLSHVNRAIPSQISLVSLEQNNNTYLITGYALSNVTVARFIDKLKETGLFQNLSLTYIRPTTMDGEDVLSFEVTGMVFSTLPVNTAVQE